MYNVFIVNSDGSKLPIMSYDSNTNTYEQVCSIVNNLDKDLTYSIELNTGSNVTILL